MSHVIRCSQLLVAYKYTCTASMVSVLCANVGNGMTLQLRGLGTLRNIRCSL